MSLKVGGVRDEVGHEAPGQDLDEGVGRSEEFSHAAWKGGEEPRERERSKQATIVGSRGPATRPGVVRKETCFCPDRGCSS